MCGPESAVDGTTRCRGDLSQGDTPIRDNMTIAWAKIVAAHLVKQVKRYSSGYCGGRTQLLELPAIGEPQFVTDKVALKSLEDYLAEIDGAMQLVLPDKRTNEDTVQHRVDVLTDMIRSLRTQFVHKIGLATLAISGQVPTLKVTPSQPPDLPQEHEQ